jgi:hypothetical protein
MGQIHQTWAWATAFFLFAASVSQAALIDGFESAASPAEWAFSVDPVSPGATGSLASIPGYTGNGARLSADLTAGGAYTGAQYTLPQPVTAAFLKLWVRHPGSTRIGLQIQDSSGQLLNYLPNRPFEASDPAQWYHLVVDLGRPDTFSAGANDGALHNPITSIMIMAEPTLTKTGNVDFDQVQTTKALSITLSPAAKAFPSGVSDFRNSAGVEIENIENTPTALNLVNTLGFRWIRTEMYWGDIELVPGVYDFSYYDGLVSQLSPLGLKPEFILCYGNPLYTNDDWFGTPLTPGADTAFASFCAAAAAHFAATGARFEIWNEPDNVVFWPAPDPIAYSAACAAATAAMHQAAPAVQVTTGGLVGVDLPFLDSLLAAGGAVGANAIALHPYRMTAPEQLSNELTEARAHVALGGQGSPKTLWSTEAGYASYWFGYSYSGAARRIQAKYGARQILTGLALGFPFQVYFALHDHGTDPSNEQDNFGIVDNAYQPKALTKAVSTLFLECGERPFKGNVPSGLAGLHVLKFADPASVLLVAWLDSASNGTQDVSLAAQPVRAVNFKGAAVSVAPAAGGAWSVAIGNSPVYLLFGRGG